MKTSFLLKDSVLYGVASQISRLSALIIIPFVTKNFPKDIYALYDSLNVLSFVLIALITMGQDSAVARYFYDTNDEKERKSIISNGFIFEIIFSTFLVPFLIFFSDLIMDNYLGSNDYNEILIIVFITLPFRSLTQFFQNILKWTFKRNKYLLLTIGHTILLVSLVLLGIKVLSLSIKDLFVAILFSYVIGSIVGFIFCRKYICFSLNIGLTKKLILFGWPYAMMGIVAQLYPVVDRKIISSNFTLEELAVYALAFRIGSLLRVPMGAFMMAWGPYAYSRIQRNDNSKNFSSVLFYSTLIIGFFTLTINLNANFLISILGTKGYSGANDFIYLITTALLIESMAIISGIGIDFSKKSIYAGLSYLISLIIGVISMLLLKDSFNVLGIAFGFLIGKTALTSLKTLFAYRIDKIRFNFLKPAIMIIYIVTLSLLYKMFFTQNSIALDFLSFSLITLGYVLLAMVIISKTDRELIFSLLKISK